MQVLLSESLSAVSPHCPTRWPTEETARYGFNVTVAVRLHRAIMSYRRGVSGGGAISHTHTHKWSQSARPTFTRTLALSCSVLMHIARPSLTSRSFLPSITFCSHPVLSPWQLFALHFALSVNPPLAEDFWFECFLCFFYKNGEKNVYKCFITGGHFSSLKTSHYKTNKIKHF